MPSHFWNNASGQLPVCALCTCAAANLVCVPLFHCSNKYYSLLHFTDEKNGSPKGWATYPQILQLISGIHDSHQAAYFPSLGNQYATILPLKRHPCFPCNGLIRPPTAAPSLHDLTALPSESFCFLMSQFQTPKRGTLVASLGSDVFLWFIRRQERWGQLVTQDCRVPGISCPVLRLS